VHQPGFTGLKIAGYYIYKTTVNNQQFEAKDGDDKLNLNFIVKCTNSQMTIEYQGLKAVTGGPVQKAKRYLKKSKIQITN